MKRLFFIIFTIIIIFSYLTVISYAAYSVYLKSIKCEKIDKSLVLVKRCEVKAERGKKGVLYVHVEFLKPLEREMKIFVNNCAFTQKKKLRYIKNFFQMRVQFFWRGSNGRFQPYIIDAVAGIFPINF